MNFENFIIDSRDGYPLAASVFEADGGPVIVFNSAMGVGRRFYAPFAQFLQARGFTVITYDYRGIGESAPEKLRGFKANLVDWGEKDQQAMLEWAQATFPEKPLIIGGHSVGGQLIGLAPSARAAKALFAVGSQSGYWAHWDGAMRVKIWLTWHVFIPLLSRLMGYFPSPWFGIGGNLPAGCARQWARWGRDPEYLHGKHAPAGAIRYAELEAQMLALWIADDHLAPRRAIEALLDWYTSADIDFRAIHPKDFGHERIGHFHVFRENTGLEVWHLIADWLRTLPEA